MNTFAQYAVTDLSEVSFRYKNGLHIIYPLALSITNFNHKVKIDFVSILWEMLIHSILPFQALALALFVEGILK